MSTQIFRRKDGREYWGNKRKEKRAGSKEAKWSGHNPVAQAFDEGGAAGHYGQPYKNPYPPGKRRDAYDHGYRSADPMGDFHGTNN